MTRLQGASHSSRLALLPRLALTPNPPPLCHPTGDEAAIASTAQYWEALSLNLRVLREKDPHLSQMPLGLWGAALLYRALGKSGTIQLRGSDVMALAPTALEVPSPVLEEIVLQVGAPPRNPLARCVDRKGGTSAKHDGSFVSFRWRRIVCSPRQAAQTRA